MIALLIRWEIDFAGIRCAVVQVESEEPLLRRLWTEPEPKADRRGGKNDARNQRRPESRTEAIRECDRNKQRQAKRNEDHCLSGKPRDSGHVLLFVPHGDERHDAHNRER